MGIDMKITKLKKLFRIAGAAVLFVALVNCGKDIKVGLKDLGVESSPDDIDQALDQAALGASLTKAKPGQVVHFEENYTVDLNAVIRIADVIRTFKTSTTDSTGTKFFMNEDFFAYDVDGNVKEEKHSEVTYEMKKAMEAASLAMQANSASTNEVCGAVTEDTDGSKFDCIRYYNFKSVHTVEPPPAKAKARPNCGNIPNCQLPVTKITFDRVKLLAGKFVQKEIFEISASSVVPFLFPDLGLPINYFCLSKLYHSEERSYFVNKCTVLRDLQL